jgi:hypothetical protein
MEEAENSFIQFLIQLSRNEKKLFYPLEVIKFSNIAYTQELLALLCLNYRGTQIVRNWSDVSINTDSRKVKIRTRFEYSFTTTYYIYVREQL